MKTIALAAALAIALPGVANAGGWHHRHDDAIVAGSLGLLGGMIIGGALAQPAPAPVYVAPAPVYVAPGYIDPAAAHASWCASHYRSWSAYDNTWIDRKGRLRACVSPYFR